LRSPHCRMPARSRFGLRWRVLNSWRTWREVLKPAEPSARYNLSREVVVGSGDVRQKDLALPLVAYVGPPVAKHVVR